MSHEPRGSSRRNDHGHDAHHGYTRRGRVGRVPARLGAAGVVVAAVAVMILAGLVIPVVHQPKYTA